MDHYCRTMHSLNAESADAHELKQEAEKELKKVRKYYFFEIMCEIDTLPPSLPPSLPPPSLSLFLSLPLARLLLVPEAQVLSWRQLFEYQK